jgi:DNA repair protein SbcC/Rad50
VLIAIEFALFGLGSDSGSSVLRVGEESGEVRMAFDVDGTDYEVRRRLLRKSGRVQQSDGYLTTPTETLNLSPSELKEKVLEVLEFNEAPDPKAQSWIYRYAVYTPQEEMKAILALAPEQRLQILRRAFRVEDYKMATTNAEESMRQIRVDVSGLEGVSRGVEELRLEVGRLQKEEDDRRKELGGLEGTVARAEGELSLLKAKRGEFQEREMGLQGAKAEREYYERIKSEASMDAEDLGRDVEKLRAELAVVERSIVEAAGRRAPSVTPVAKLRQKERSLEGKVRRLTGLRATVESKLSDYESIMRQGVCPVCDRPVEAHDFEERRERKDVEREHVVEELEEAEGNLGGVRQLIEETKEYLEERKELARRRSEWTRLKREILKKGAMKRKFEKRISFAEAAVGQLLRKLEELQQVVDDSRAAEGRIVEAEEVLRKVRDDLAKGQERLLSVREERTKIAAEVVVKEEASRKGARLRERGIWLSDYFVPTVQVIEKSVLATINQEFDSLFRRWFGVLVNDPEKEVSVDEDFTPVVSQGEYDQDVRFLSGGERTSVALAYRLALNVLAQRSSIGMKSNLLILDEPTDGFSKEQLGNVREVLDEVGCPQVIIVSHDKELESFADQIFRVDKAGGVSVVRPP